MYRLFKILICTILLSSIVDMVYCQETVSLTSVVFDRTTAEPIPYIKVGIDNKDIGVVSSSEGYFDLMYLSSAVDLRDTLKIYVNGYYPWYLPSTKISSYFNDREVIFLNPIKIQSNDELVTDEMETIRLGTEEISNGVSASVMDRLQIGGAILTKLSIPFNKVKLNAFSFNVLQNKADKVLIRLSLYNIINNEPGKSIIHDPILYEINTKEGIHTIDLSASNIVVDSDIAVGFELLAIEGESLDVDLAIAKKSGTTFIRNTTFSNWQNYPIVGLAFTMTGEVLKEDVSTTSTAKDGNNSATINGVVETFGKPIQGARIGVKGTLREAVTNFDGEFSIKAAVEDILLVEFFTMKSKSVTIGEMGTLRINLEPKYDDLGEVLITADIENNYEEEVNTAIGKQTKRSLGYAAYSKKREELVKGATNALELLTGRFPGLLVNPNSGEISIRGNSSFTLSNNPLIVIDGVPFFGNLQLIDANNVVDISIIPGLVGATRFGSLGRNGVILVKTKSGTFEDKEKDETHNTMLVEGNDYKDIRPIYDTTMINKNIIPSSLNTLEAKAEFDQILKHDSNNISKYLEGYKYFKNHDSKYAMSIISKLESISENNLAILTSLSFIYEKEGQYERALAINKKIADAYPFMVQSYLNLARAYVSVKNYESAFQLYKNLLYQDLIGVEVNDEIYKIIETELRHLVTKYKSKVPYSELPSAMFEKSSVLDTRMVFDWNSTDASFEIQFVNPEKKYFIWSHTHDESRIRILNEIKYGFSSEEFIIEDLGKGKWIINIENKSNEAAKIPHLLKYTLYNNYGSQNETKEIELISIADLNEKMTLLTIEK